MYIEIILLVIIITCLLLLVEAVKIRKIIERTDKRISPKEVDEDDLYKKAVEFVEKERKASATLLQRKFKIGYARAARLLDLMEDDGLIGPDTGSRSREVYMIDDDMPTGNVDK